MKNPMLPAWLVLAGGLVACTALMYPALSLQVQAGRRYVVRARVTAAPEVPVGAVLAGLSTLSDVHYDESKHVATYTITAVETTKLQTVELAGVRIEPLSVVETH